jgi:putative flippase GtrA
VTAGESALPPGHARAIARSAVGSLAALALELALLPPLIRALHLPAAAFLLVQLVATALTFVVNRCWAFEARRGRVGGQAVRAAAVAAGSIALNTALPSFGWYVLGAPPALAFATAAALVYLGWNYPLQRWWVFRPRAPVPPSARCLSPN